VALLYLSGGRFQDGPVMLPAGSDEVGVRGHRAVVGVTAPKADEPHRAEIAAQQG
jgi:hypothetical protein